MDRKIYIYGASGHGKVVAEIAEAAGYELVGFIDDSKEPKEIFGFFPITFEEFLALNPNNTSVALGIGHNLSREKIFRKLLEHNIEVATLIHPAAIVSKRASVAKGTVIMAGTLVNPGAVIGMGVILNSHSVIEHDCLIGDFVHISPNAALAGNVEVGALTHIGIGSATIQGIRIGHQCIIGAGSIVIKDIPDFAKVVGNPATRILN